MTLVMIARAPNRIGGVLFRKEAVWVSSLRLLVYSQMGSGGSWSMVTARRPTMPLVVSLVGGFKPASKLITLLQVKIASLLSGNDHLRITFLDESHDIGNVINF